jgi:hypothetical protein
MFYMYTIILYIDCKFKNVKEMLYPEMFAECKIDIKITIEQKLSPVFTYVSFLVV